MAKNDYLPSVSGTFNNNANFGQGRDYLGQSVRTDAFNNSASIGANMQIYNGGRIKKLQKNLNSI